MARPTKYKKKYAKELLDGIRYKEGLSIEKLCWRWGITEKTYHNWRAEYKSFDEAAEHGERDFKVYWYDKLVQGVADGKASNGALLKFCAQNVLGWTDKKQIQQDTPTHIGTITINQITPPNRDYLEHKEDNNNIIELNAERDKVRTDE